MQIPTLPIWLDKKIAANEKHLQSIGVDADASKVINYLNALRHGKITFSTEPVIHIKTSQVLYWEYLLRMKDVDGTDLFTGSVLEALYRWDVLPLVGQYLIELALIQAVERGCSVGLNIPPQLFMSRRFRNHLAERLLTAQKSGIVPPQVFLEVLETPKMDIDDSMADMFSWMDNIIQDGYSIGLDDFGAGNGCHTIEHVKKLPISFLKLDGDVTRTMLNNTFDADAYKEVFNYCTTNNIDIIAEHVENTADAHILSRKYPITHIQSRHVMPEDFA